MYSMTAPGMPGDCVTASIRRPCVLFPSRQQLRSVAEAGLRKEVGENNDGLQQMRESLPKEIDNITAIATLLTEKEAGGTTDRRTPAKLGLDVIAFTNANWQAASATGAVELMNYQSVERFAGAYFEQARLAQLQTATLESMMVLASYVGHGERIASMTPEQARSANMQAPTTAGPPANDVTHERWGTRSL